MPDADSPFLVRVVSVTPPDRLLGCSVGDVFVLPAAGALSVGADPRCAIRHDRYPPERQPARPAVTLELQVQGDVVNGRAREGAHFDSREHTRRAILEPGVPFKPTSGLRLQIERSGAVDVGQRLQRIRDVLVDDPPDAPWFFRRGVLNDDARTPVTVVVAVGDAVVSARNLVLAGAQSSAACVGTVLSRVERPLFVLVLADHECVGVDELLKGLHACGERIEPALALFVVEQLLAQAGPGHVRDLQGAGIRLRDGQPVLSPWALRARTRPARADVLLNTLPRGGDQPLRVNVEPGASVADVVALLQTRRGALDDAEARARLRALVQVTFPSRLQRHADFHEQAALVDPSTVPAWIVHEGGVDPDVDIDPDARLDDDDDDDPHGYDLR